MFFFLTQAHSLSRNCIIQHDRHDLIMHKVVMEPLKWISGVHPSYALSCFQFHAETKTRVNYIPKPIISERNSELRIPTIHTRRKMKLLSNDYFPQRFRGYCKKQKYQKKGEKVRIFWQESILYNLDFFVFQILIVKLECFCRTGKYCLYIKMAKRNSKKHKKYLFYEEKSLLGLTPGLQFTFFLFLLLFKIYFWCDLTLLAVFIIFVFFCHQVVHINLDYLGEHED